MVDRDTKVIKDCIREHFESPFWLSGIDPIHLPTWNVNIEVAGDGDHFSCIVDRI